MVQALAIIADPLARDTIMTAFDEGLVDEYVITRECVIKEYDDARPREDDLDDNWLSDYLADYADHIESLRPPSPPAKPATIPRPKYRYQDRYDEGEPPPDVPATQPIRNNGADEWGATTPAGAVAARNTKSATWARIRRPECVRATRKGGAFAACQNDFRLGRRLALPAITQGDLDAVYSRLAHIANTRKAPCHRVVDPEGLVFSALATRSR